MTTLTYADVFRPTTKHYATVYDATLIFGAALLMALAARLSFFLPFSPVPVTAQTLMVLLTGALLGSRRGALAVMVYLAQGALGLPIFAAGGGPLYLFGPTGGYLLGFIAAAYITGKLSERGWDRRNFTAALAMLTGNLVLYACGVLWLQTYVGLRAALLTGVLPFIPGDLLKIMMATLLLPLGWRYVRPTPQD